MKFFFDMDGVLFDWEGSFIPMYGDPARMPEDELKKAKETALSLAEMGLPVEKIAKAVNHNVNEVQKWIDENLCAIK